MDTRIENGWSGRTPSAASAIEGFITFKIGRLRKLLDRYSAADLLKHFDLTLAEWRILATLHVASPTTVKWLAATLIADKAEISRACAKLVGRGLVKRLSDDGHLVVFSITRKGSNLHDAIVPRRSAIQEELASQLTPEELAGLNSAAHKLIDYLAGKLASGALTKRNKSRR